MFYPEWTSGQAVVTGDVLLPPGKEIAFIVIPHSLEMIFQAKTKRSVMEDGGNLTVHVFGIDHGGNFDCNVFRNETPR